MKKMTIYEPALCCDTGLCGVNVDPELLRITTVLAALRGKGIVIDRFNLNNAPMEFVKNNSVNQKLNEGGVEILPIVTIDGEVVMTGRYPQNDEILDLLGLSAWTLLPAGSASCCGGGDDCCSGSVSSETNSSDSPDEAGIFCCGDASDEAGISCCGQGAQEPLFSIGEPVEEDRRFVENANYRSAGCCCGGNC